MDKLGPGTEIYKGVFSINVASHAVTVAAKTHFLSSEASLHNVILQVMHCWKKLLHYLLQVVVWWTNKERKIHITIWFHSGNVFQLWHSNVILWPLRHFVYVTLRPTLGHFLTHLTYLYPLVLFRRRGRTPPEVSTIGWYVRVPPSTTVKTGISVSNDNKKGAI